jgi:hypothetical protein
MLRAADCILEKLTATMLRLICSDALVLFVPVHPMAIFFQRLLQVLLVAGMAIPCSNPALAHSPYFTQTESFALPNGETGEIRLINGDGILGPNPIWTVVINSQGTVIARSEQAVQMVIVCLPEHRCHGFNLIRRLVLEPDPATFKQGPDALDVWGVIGDVRRGDGWGFRERPATAIEVIEATIALAGNNILTFLVPFIAAALVIIVFLNLRQWPPRRSRLTWLIWIGAVVLRLAIAAILLAISLAWALFDALPLYVWLAFAATGAGSMLTLVYLIRRRDLPSQRQAPA